MSSNSTFWKRKLLAYLHDTPSKCLDIFTHGEQSAAAMIRAGFNEDEVRGYSKAADHTAAAADRFPFPDSRASGLKCKFDGVTSTFHHPLGGSQHAFMEPLTAVEGIEGEGTIQPIVDSEDWQQRFFAHWRLWEKFAIEKDARMGFLPADTRIPDHTIWSHMGVVAALAGCAQSDKSDAPILPAFLKFQIGPVQDFIAQARSTRDLWSGSYLLSWLMAAGMKALSAQAGPDSVIFPNLKEQPLFDLHWKHDLWEKINLNDKSGWHHLDWDHNQIQTPNLPNVFLAVVPGGRAKELALLVETSIRDEWKRISEACRDACREKKIWSEQDEMDKRFEHQVSRFLSISWQITPWPQDIQQAREQVQTLPSAKELLSRFDKVVKAAEEGIPIEHRDGRYFHNVNGRTELRNTGLAWSLIYMLNSWQLDAVRQVRGFKGWSDGGWSTGDGNTKDFLNGKDEAVIQGELNWNNRFKKGDAIGAITLIKRIWDFAYLKKDPWELPHSKMPNTRGVAAHDPDSDGDEECDVEDIPDDEKYFAVLAFDGDEIGKWMSGDLCPTFGEQFASYKEDGKKQGAKPYFEGLPDRTLLDTRRLVSPGYHLQFSTALSNFALKCARPIVEAFDGRLIYAGGDDVLALLPADTALDCADALQKAFRGEAVPRAKLQQVTPGFVSFEGDDKPFMVLGPRATASVGIAMAHFKSPLQDVVREAQSAEKRAKQELGRNAVAVTLLKRSGEITQWGCKWDSGGLELFDVIMAKLADKSVSGKFPYQICELLDPYLSIRTEISKQEGVFTTLDVTDVIRKEITFAVERQSERGSKDQNLKDLIKALDKYLKGISELIEDRIKRHPKCDIQPPQEYVKSIIGLCTTAAFANRTRPKEDSEKP